MKKHNLINLTLATALCLAQGAAWAPQGVGGGGGYQASGGDWRQEATPDGAGGGAAEVPLCGCGVPARELTSQSEKNPGRLFYK